jgi:6,7-dimethyl-8-ribityllumazine synthase
VSAEFTGTLDGRGLRVGIVVARFNEIVTRPLLDGARTGLTRLGVADEAIDVAWTPGCFEVPLVARRLADSGRYDAVICLGAVIRGETPHFDYIARTVADGLARVALEVGIPVTFGLLTTDDAGQALARAGGKHGNKGWDAALAALELADLATQMGGPGAGA